MTKMSRVRSGLRPTSEVCADCGAGETNWSSVNRGVYLCNDCVSVHRSLGRHISIVKHLKKSLWHPNLQHMVQHLISAGANSIWEHTLLDPAQMRSGKRKPNPSDHIYPKKDEFIRSKYLFLNYVHRLPCDDNSTRDISMQLHSSVRTANVETSLRLLSLGAQANFVHPEKRNTPLHVAAKAGQALQVELLMTYGANPHALDINRKSPEDLARLEGHSDIADRLVELKYELSDRLTYYVSQQKPDHKSGKHYKITNPVGGLPGNEGRIRLQKLNDQTFEELAMDVYDEVDRRELDQIWREAQRSIIIPGAKALNTSSEHQDVPFLPLNSDYSTTRNQGRQKLALFKEHEFKSLISDIISDIVRRQNLYGTAFVDASDEEPIYDLPPDGVLDCNTIERSIAVPETISIEKYEELRKKFEAKEKECLTLQELNRDLSSKVTILAKERHELTKKVNTLTALTNMPASTSSIPNQSNKNTGPKSPSARPNSVYNPHDSSGSQSSLHSSDSRRRTICAESQFNNNSARVPSQDELRQPINMPKNLTEEGDSTLETNRVGSEYDNNNASESQPKNEDNSKKKLLSSPSQTSGSDRDSPQNNTNTNNNLSLDTPSPCLSDEGVVADTYKDALSRISPANILEEKFWPEKVDLNVKTEQLTRNIQALHSSAQSRKIENYLQCAENIYSAVNDVIALFPKPNCDKDVKGVLQQIVGCAHKLRQRCKDISQDEIDNNDRVKQVTEEIMAYALEVAKAEKELVTMSSASAADVGNCT